MDLICLKEVLFNKWTQAKFIMRGSVYPSNETYNNVIYFVKKM